MCTALNLLASSMNGRFSPSESSFHSAPNRLEISELCIFGFSWAIFRLCPLDHTIKAFMGRFTRSAAAAAALLLFVLLLLLELLLLELVLLLLVLLLLLLLGVGTWV